MMSAPQIPQYLQFFYSTNPVALSFVTLLHKPTLGILSYIINSCLSKIGTYVIIVIY